MISIEAKLEAIHKGLDAVADELPYLDKDILRRLGRGVVQKSKQRYKEVLKKRTGLFYNSIKPVYSRRLKAMVVSASAESPRGVRYPFVLAHGFRNEPRTGRKVFFGERDWIERPGRQYMWSEKADDDIEYVINYALEKLKKKGVIA